MIDIRKNIMRTISLFLDSIDAPYIVLRDSHLKQHGDLDILLRAEDRELLLNNLAELKEYYVVRVAKYFNTTALWLTARSDFSETLHVDLMSELPLSNQHYITAKDALKKREFCEMLAFLLPGSRFQISSSIRPHYIERAKDIFLKNKERISLLLNNELSPVLRHKIEAILQGEPTQVKELDFTDSNPLFIRKRKFLKAQRLYDILMHNDPQRITFLGPDGAGKSTLIDAMLPVLKKWSKEVRVIHLKPIVFFPERHQFRGIVTDPHAKPPRDIVSASLKLLSYNFEYWIDTIINARNPNRLDVFDRHLWDMKLDPKRYRLKNLELLTTILAKATPQLNQLFVLTVDADVIQKRKQEVPYDESVRAVDTYREFVHHHLNAVHIDTSVNADLCAHVALNHYAHKLHQKSIKKISKSNSNSIFFKKNKKQITKICN